MKTGKRVWSALLALIMVFGMIVPVHAEDGSAGESVLTGFSVNSITVTREKANAASTFSDLITVAEGSELWEENVPMRAQFSNPDDNLNGSLAVMQYMFEGLTLTDGEDRSDNTQWEADYAYRWPLTVSYDGQTYNVNCLVKVVENEGDVFVTKVVGLDIASVTMTPNDMTTITEPDGSTVKVYNPSVMRPEVNVVYNNGVVRTFNWFTIYVDSNGTLDLRNYDDLRNTADWTASEEPYSWKVCLVDPQNNDAILAEYDMSIIVKEQPKITGIKVSDVVMYEGAGYYVGDGEGGQFLYFDVVKQNPNVELSYDDGTTATYTCNQLRAMGYSLEDYSEYNQDWSAGNIYEWPMALIAENRVVKETTVKVAVYAEGKVPEGIGRVPVRMEVADVTMSEDDQIITTHPDGTAVEHYDLYQADPLVTIYYSDGTSESENLLELHTIGYAISVNDGTNWVVGTNTEVTYLMDYNSWTRLTPNYEFQVTITEGTGEVGSAVTVTGITVDPVTMREDEKTPITYNDGTSAMVYDISEKDPLVTIYYSDDTSKQFLWSEVEAATGYTMGHGTDEGIIGTAGWLVGNTYQWPVNLVDWNNNGQILAETDVSVSIQPGEVRITGFSIEPVTMMQGMEQSLHAAYEEEFWAYNIREKNPNITVAYSDGSVYQGTWQGFEDQGMESISWDPADTKDWAQAGTYTQSVWIGNVETQVTVILTPNPVESVTFKPVTMIQGVDVRELGLPDGTSVEVYDIAWVGNPEMTVTFNDGRAPLETYWCDISQYGFNMPEYEDNILDTADWGVGTHTFQVRALGKTVDVTVIIEEDPIESVTVTDGTLTEVQDRYEETIYYPDTQEAVTLNVLNLNKVKEAVFTIKYKDGTVKSGTMRELQQQNLRIWFEQDITVTADWTVGNTYEVTYSVEGRIVKSKVKLLSNPIKSVEIAPLQIKFSESVFNDYYDPMIGTWVEYRYYNVHEKTKVTINFTDGTSKTIPYHSLYQEGYDNCELLVDQSADAVWQPGSVHTATFRGLGVELEFQVTVVDDRVKTISAVAQYPLYADISAGADCVANTAPMITATWADGTKKTFNFERIYEVLPNSEWTMGLETTPEEWALAVGQHNVVLTIDGVSCTFPITVEENPVKDIKVITKHPFVENVHGVEDCYTDANGQEIKNFRYTYWSLPYTVQVTLKDGTVENYGSEESLYERFRSLNNVPSLRCDPNVVKGPGEYTLEVYILNMETKQTITIIPSTIKDITAVFKKQLVENIGGRREDGYFHYDINSDYLEFTVTYTDGTTEKLSAYDTILGTFIMEALYIKDDQSWENPWGVGKHTVELSLLGFSPKVEVEVLKNTLEKITAKATKALYEDWHWASYDGGETRFYDFWYAFPEITLYYTDGTTKTCTYTQLQKEFGYENVEFDQIAVGTPGTKKAVLRLLDLSCQFDVEVKPNPVVSITAKPTKTLTEGYLGFIEDLYYEGQYYDFYNYVPQDTIPIYTIKFNDGTSVTLHGDDQVFEKYLLYPFMDGMTPDKPWSVGKHTVKVELMGKTFDYTFEIVKAPNPLTKITAKAVGALYENADIYSTSLYNYESLVEITQHFQDGTTKTAMANKTLDEYGRNAVDFEDGQLNLRWGVGKHTVTAAYKGLRTQFEIEVLANPYTSVAISNEGGFAVTLKRADGSETVWKATDFQVRDINDLGCNGNLVTNQGDFFVTFRFAAGEPAQITYMEYQGLRSNSLSDCSWLDQKLTTEVVGDVPELVVGYKDSDTADTSKDMTTESLKDIVASEGDATKGEIARVWMAVTEVSTDSLPEAEAAKIEEALDSLEDHEAGIVLDMSIYKQYAGDSSLAKVSTTNKPIVFTMAVPQSLIDSGAALAEIKIIRIHNGEAEILDTVYDKETQTITFETDSFSTYSMTYSTHNLTKVEAKAPTCTEAGNTAYYTCSHCDKLFADAEAKTETTKEAVTKAAAGHGLTKTEAKAATCTEAGNTAYWTCGTCKKLFADSEGKNETTAEKTVVAAAGHGLTKTEAKAATCTEAGNTAYWTCGTCKKLFADSEGKNETTAEKTVVAAAGHSLTKVEAKAATTEAEGCKEHYKCDTCGELFADAEGKTAVKAADLVIPKLTKPADGSNAQTGDSTPVGMLMLLMIVSGLLLVGECLFGKKRFR